eukprot:TRINITY_DN7530_c1_g1_i4.p1 TRINITY_DN7530_c1_g1~~TRINITY_DN7530_c1_g1_i4.p1  ORF type:complete len:241 (-),score=46.18 TRINITY_DN7530_c1_g1_i4:438-1088(-)
MKEGGDQQQKLDGNAQVQQPQLQPVVMPQQPVAQREIQSKDVVGNNIGNQQQQIPQQNQQQQPQVQQQQQQQDQSQAQQGVPFSQQQQQPQQPQQQLQGMFYPGMVNMMAQGGGSSVGMVGQNMQLDQQQLNNVAAMSQNIAASSQFMLPAQWANLGMMQLYPQLMMQSNLQMQQQQQQMNLQQMQQIKQEDVIEADQDQSSEADGGNEADGEQDE